LENVIGSTLPHSPRVETAIVKGPVEAYLSKYLSKGSDGELEGFVDDLGEDAVPGQWWFCSSLMRQRIADETVSGPNCGALLESLVNHLLGEGTGEGFEYCRHVDRIIGKSRVTCGWVGRLTPELAGEVRAMLDGGSPVL
jgi:hypothetical protein